MGGWCFGPGNEGAHACMKESTRKRVSFFFVCVCGGGVCWPRGNDKVKAALLDTLYGLIIKYLSILRYNFSQLLCYLLPTFYLPQYSLIKAFLKNICFKSIKRDYGYQL